MSWEEIPAQCRKQSHLRIRGNQERGVREAGEYAIAEGPAVLGDYRLIMAHSSQLGSDV